MVQLKSLSDALAQVETTRRGLGILSQERPEGWKKDYANLRLTLEKQFTYMLNIGDEWLARRGDIVSIQHFRDVAGKARSKLAQHQSRWPVIIIKPDAPDYRRSTAEIDTVFSEIISLVQTLSKT